MIILLKYLATHDEMKGGIQPNKPLFFNLKIIIFNIESYGKIKYDIPKEENNWKENCRREEEIE